MKRLKLAYGLLLGTMLGSAACEDLQVCNDGWCMTIDICNPRTEDCGEVDTGTENPCPDGEVVDDATGCVADGFCYPLEDGRYCTGGAILSCPDGYSPDTTDLCSEGESAMCFIYAEGFACRLTSVYTIEECRAISGVPTADPGDGSLMRGGCPDGQLTAGFIDAHWDEGGLCCRSDAPVCPGGEIVDDPTGCLMDDAFCYELPDGGWCTGPDAPVCPDGWQRDFDNRCNIADYAICTTGSEGVNCYLDALYTIEECRAAGGEAIADPGDGSVTTVGCPSGLAPLAYIDADWDEGGLCCEWLPD